MKKLILFYLLAILPQISNALVIQNIIVSPVSGSAINVQVNTQNNYTFGYNSFQFDIENNIITLDICYDPGMGAAISYLQNHFEIPLDNTVVANYQLIVNVYFPNTTTFLCDYLVIEHNATLLFSTPLTEPIYLGTPVFDGSGQISVYPNPNTGIVNIRSDLGITGIRMYDQFGRFVKAFDGPQTCDLSEFESGVYYLLLESTSGNHMQKIIKN